MPDTSWLSKNIRGPVQALIAMAAIFVAGWVGYAKAESWVEANARRTAQAEVAEIKPLVKEIHQDAKFTRCALVAHVRNKPDELFSCDQMAAPPSPGK